MAQSHTSILILGTRTLAVEIADVISEIKDVKVTGAMTCTFYGNGKPMPEMAGKEHKIVTPEESGLEEREVRCINCSSSNNSSSKCNLYIELNKMPNFNLNINIKKSGCCNANTPK